MTNKQRSIKRAGAAVSAILLAACGASEVADPYADLGAGLRVTFVSGLMEDAASCNPDMQFALRSDAPAIRLNLAFVVNQAQILSSGFSLVPSDIDGVLTAEQPLSSFDPLPKACSDVTLELHDYNCEFEGEPDIACPALEFVGTDAFAAFDGAR